MRTGLVASFVLVLLMNVGAVSQETKKPVVTISPVGRLRAAHSVFLRQGEGNDFPYRVFESSLTGWGRFNLVDSPEKADIVIEISAPSDDSGVSVSSTTSQGSPLGGSSETSIKTSKQLSVSRILLSVYDARSRARLWFASERPKSAMKQRAREDNLVDATQQLFSKFRDAVEPPAQ